MKLEPQRPQEQQQLVMMLLVYSPTQETQSPHDLKEQLEPLNLKPQRPQEH